MMYLTCKSYFMVLITIRRSYEIRWCANADRSTKNRLDLKLFFTRFTEFKYFIFTKLHASREHKTCRNVFSNGLGRALRVRWSPDETITAHRDNGGTTSVPSPGSGLPIVTGRFRFLSGVTALRAPFKLTILLLSVMICLFFSGYYLNIIITGSSVGCRRFLYARRKTDNPIFTRLCLSACSSSHV